jgi:hypothetical protein
MIDTLTDAELGTLRSKLYSAGHKFAQEASTIADKALAMPVLSAEHDAEWDRRQQFVDAMADMYGMAEDSEKGTMTLLGGSPYEAARERFELIARTRPKIVADARALIEWAEREWSDANAALAEFESSPGIPLPQYRDSWDFAKPAMSVRLDG